MAVCVDILNCMKKVMAFGTFDLLHPGHVHFLSQAKKHGDYLVVVIARDETVMRVKGRTSVYGEQDRQKNVLALNIADKVILGNLGDKFQVIRDEAPDVIVLGYDQKSIVENLEEKVGKNIKIVRLGSLRPEIYKSSKLREKSVP